MSPQPLANTWGMSVPTAQGPVTAVALVDASGNIISTLKTVTTDAYGNVVLYGQAVTAGGCETYSFLSTAAVQTVSIKASPGQVYGLQFFNNSASIWYGRLYNLTGAPGSTDGAAILYRFLVPGNTSGAGFVVPMPSGAAMQFTAGIGLRVSGAIADNDTTVLSANVLLGNVLFK